MHIIQSLPVEPSNNVHQVLEDDGSVERSRLWRVSRRVDLHESPLVNIKLVDVIKSLLVCIDSSKDVDVAAADHRGVPVSGLGWRTIGTMDLVPVIG